MTTNEQLQISFADMVKEYFNSMGHGITRFPKEDPKYIRVATSIVPINANYRYFNNEIVTPFEELYHIPLYWEFENSVFANTDKKGIIFFVDDSTSNAKNAIRYIATVKRLLNNYFKNHFNNL